MKSQNRTEVGGNIGLQFGNVTLIEISPRVGYWFTGYVISGVGTNFLYMNDTRPGGYKGTIYGVNIFTRLYPSPKFYAHAEYLKMNAGVMAGGGVVYRIWTDGLLLGGGYAQPITENTSMNISILWDVIGQSNFPYRNPVISMGVVTRL